MSKTLTIIRISNEIFQVTGNWGYWDDGSVLSGRFAFDGGLLLSASKAQALDAANGLSYILVTPAAIKRQSVIDAALTLAVGMTAVVSID